MSTLLIRADATTQMGTGHVMRCLALAQGWQDHGGTAVFYSHCESDALRRRIANEGFDFIPFKNTLNNGSDIKEETLKTLEQLKMQNAKCKVWTAIDGYHFDAEYQKRIKEAGYNLLAIDDYGHADHYYADIVLNQNIYAHPRIYSNREAYTQLLLGSRYVLLRREFRTWQGWTRKISPIGQKMLVTMGGSDPDDTTLKVVQALQKIARPDLEAAIIIGPANPHRRRIEEEIGNLPFAVHILTSVRDMPEQMAWADMAVSAGGTTCWEMAFMGLPCIMLVLSENQRANAEELDRGGIAINMGWHEKVLPSQIGQSALQLLDSAETRADLTRQGQVLVDGDGIERLLMRMRGDRFRLRRVCQKDVKLIWEWSNDPDVRVASFTPEPIPWERHLQWFTSKLSDPDCVFYIAVNEEEMPIGQVRYEISGQEATVSISLSNSYRGKGYGSAVLIGACRQFFLLSRAKLIHAYVKTGNEISMQTFVKAGFKEAGTALIHDQPAFHLVLSKEAMA